MRRGCSTAQPVTKRSLIMRRAWHNEGTKQDHAAFRGKQQNKSSLLSVPRTMISTANRTLHSSSQQSDNVSTHANAHHTLMPVTTCRMVPFISALCVPLSRPEAPLITVDMRGRRWSPCTPFDGVVDACLTLMKQVVPNGFALVPDE